MIFLALLYGGRKGEVANLKWKNVDLENNVYYLIDTKNGNDYKKTLPFIYSVYSQKFFKILISFKILSIETL